MSTILGFITGLSSKVYIGIILILLTLTGVFWTQHYLSQREVSALNLKNQELQQEVFTEKVKVTGLRTVVETLQQTYEKLGQVEARERQIEKDIESAPSSDNDKTAPVLRRALGDVNRMLHN